MAIGAEFVGQPAERPQATEAHMPLLAPARTGTHAVKLTDVARPPVDAYRVRVTTVATFRPEAPQTPAPGNVAAPAQNRPRTAVV